MLRDVSRQSEPSHYPAKIRVLLVDDHASFRELLATILGLEVDVSVRAEAGTVAEASQHLEGIDVAIVDLGLPDAHGTELISLIRDSYPDIRVLVLTGTDRRLDIAKSIESGAAGVLSKAVAVYEIVDATRRVYLGEFLHSPVETVELLRLSEAERKRDRERLALKKQLSADELTVLDALSKGLSEKEIAEKAGLDPEEERRLMSAVLEKLGVQTPLQAAVTALRAGLVEVGQESDT